MFVKILSAAYQSNVDKLSGVIGEFFGSMKSNNDDDDNDCDDFTQVVGKNGYTHLDDFDNDHDCVLAELRGPKIDSGESVCSHRLQRATTQFGENK